uniref:SprT-like domain-containing protein n=1 Tax=Rhabditophanes sp. KR3021 TaxID=114890 RepID=A0AC35TFT8_9BILA
MLLRGLDRHLFVRGLGTFTDGGDIFLFVVGLFGGDGCEGRNREELFDTHFEEDAKGRLRILEEIISSTESTTIGSSQTTQLNSVPESTTSSSLAGQTTSSVTEPTSLFDTPSVDDATSVDDTTEDPHSPSPDFSPTAEGSDKEINSTINADATIGEVNVKIPTDALAFNNIAQDEALKMRDHALGTLSEAELEEEDDDGDGEAVDLSSLVDTPEDLTYTQLMNKQMASVGSQEKDLPEEESERLVFGDTIPGEDNHDIDEPEEGVMSPFDPAEDKAETVPVYIKKFDSDRTAKSNALKIRDMNLQHLKELHKHLDDAKVGNALKKGKQRFMELNRIEKRSTFDGSEDSPLESISCPNSPKNSYAHMSHPKREAILLHRQAEIVKHATNLIYHENFDILNEDVPNKDNITKQFTRRFLAEVVDTFHKINFAPKNMGTKCVKKVFPCDPTYKYRTPNGWCNNLKRPHFGIAFAPLMRLLKPAYDNKIDSVRSKMKSGKALPSTRVISNVLNEDKSPPNSNKFSHMVMQFGQFVAHDIDHVPVETTPKGAFLDCSLCRSNTVNEMCEPIPVPQNDPFYPPFTSSGDAKCLPFTRSLLGDSSKGYREQLTQITAFLDSSNVYGSTDCEANDLRSKKQGLMKIAKINNVNMESLPKRAVKDGCRSHPFKPCFNAGDSRSSHTAALTGMHNVFLREHNRVSKNLLAINPGWHDERLYQESRRIIAAQFQHIIYNEFLPFLIGLPRMQKADIVAKKNGFYTGYNYTCDATISQPFQTAAYRFGHTLIRDDLQRMNSDFKNVTRALRLVDVFDNAKSLYERRGNGFEAILMGLVGTPAMDFDRFMSDTIRNRLFEFSQFHLAGFDLFAINIQRGRDHAVQPYNEYRKYCGYKPFKTWAEMVPTMSQATVNKLKKLYQTTDDIDLYVGIVTEAQPKNGPFLPETASCILAEQFTRLKKCDRFFYENNVKGSHFKPKQLIELRKTSLSKILCNNIKLMTKIQKTIWLMPSKQNPLINCNTIPSVNLQAWAEGKPVKKAPPIKKPKM